MAFIAKQRYKLDIAPRGGWVIVYASQHDDGAREIEFEITNQGRAFSIPASINVSVQGIKSNGSYFSHSCSYSGNIVTMALADDMTDIVGKSICVLKFTNSSQQKLATAKFVLNIDTDSSSEGVIIDTEAEEIFNQMLNEIRAQASAISVDIAELQSMVGSPLVASTVSAMTDHNKIYVYTGSESGYTNGNWYYWNGSAWTSGGVYNAVAINIDTTFTHPGQAADAKAVGDLREKKNLFNLSNVTHVVSWVHVQVNGLNSFSVICETNGQYKVAHYILKLKPNTTYAFSGKKIVTSGVGRVAYSVSSDGETWGAYTNLISTTGIDNQLYVVTITTGADEYYRFSFFCTHSTSETGYVTYNDVMVEEGAYTYFVPYYSARDDIARHDLSNAQSAINLLEASHQIATDTAELLDTVSDDVLVLSNAPYAQELIYTVRQGENTGGVTRIDNSVVYPKASQGQLPVANAPKQFLNSVIRSYCGNSDLVYGNDHGLFSNSCTNEIDCTSFVTAVLYGIFYENSKYQQDSNIIRYHNGENMKYWNTDYTRQESYILAEYYASRKRLFAMPTQAAQAFDALEYGDILFAPNAGLSTTRYYNIAHVMFVVGKIPEGRRIVVAQAGSGQSAYKIKDFYDTVVKISVFELTSESIENCFVAFARPNYATKTIYHEPNIIDGDALLLGAIWRSGILGYSSTWSATVDEVRVNKGSKLTVLSKSTRNPVVQVQEFSEEMVFIKNTEVSTNLTLSGNTAYIAINYGFINSSGLSPTLADLSQLKIQINKE